MLEKALSTATHQLILAGPCGTRLSIWSPIWRTGAPYNAMGMGCWQTLDCGPARFIGYQLLFRQIGTPGAAAQLNPTGTALKR